MRMIGMLLTSLAVVLAGCAGVSSPYAGEESREIKALSAEDAVSLLEGRGMGFAKAAELNGYPGPLHVLELAGPLELTGAQRAQTQALFEAMQEKARALGRELVGEERKLDALFAGKRATQESVQATLRRIGELHAQVRGAHLDAHLAQVRILTPAQVARYAELRYGAGHRH